MARLGMWAVGIRPGGRRFIGGLVRRLAAPTASAELLLPPTHVACTLSYMLVLLTGYRVGMEREVGIQIGIILWYVPASYDEDACGC